MKLKMLLATAMVASSVAAGASDGTTFSGSIPFGYCVKPAQPLSFGNEGVTNAAAIRLTASNMKYFEGCRITGVSVANGYSENSAVTSIPVTAFIAETLGGEFTASVSGTMDLTKPLVYTDYMLETPIEITADLNPIYIGIQAEGATGVAPLVTDYTLSSIAGSGIGDMYGMQSNGSWEWVSAGDNFGMPCVRVIIEGEALAANEVAIFEKNLPTFMTPGSDEQVELYLRNNAGNTVTSVQVSYSVNGGEAQTANIDLSSDPLLYNEYNRAPVSFTLTAPNVEGDNLPISIDIVGINGDATNNATAANRQASTTYLGLKDGFEKAMVTEITTGIWCGFCPTGIHGVSKMYEKYTDGRFIPIAVHVSDAISDMSYSKLTNLTGSGVPSCVINRDTEAYGVQTPAFDTLDAIYESVTAQPALARPAITNMVFNPDRKRLTVEANAEFQINIEEGNYALAYVLTEDNVGPYDQTNYYSHAYNGGQLSLEWWEDQPYQVSTIYGDVSRFIKDFDGVRNSLPTSLVAGEVYTHSTEVPTNLVTDIENTKVTVMVVNRTNGRIVNAVRVPYAQFSSIETVTSDVNNDSRAEYFDLQGRRVENPASGKIYIRRNGSESTKIRL